MITILAMSDMATWVMWIVGLVVVIAQFGFNIIVGIAVTSMNRKTARIDELEAKHESSARELIEQQMATVTQEFLGVIGLLKEQVKDIRERLIRGDDDFKDLNKRDYELELKLTNKIELLKEWARDTFASKRHADSLQNQINDLRSNNRDKAPTAS